MGVFFSPLQAGRRAQPFQALTCSLSQSHQASTPSPVLAETGNT